MNKSVMRMSKTELRNELRNMRNRLTRREGAYERISFQLDYQRDWNLRIINAMSAAHSKRGLAAYIVIYVQQDGKEKRKLFLTQRRANKFRDRLIPLRSHAIRVEPLYFT